MRAPRWQHYLTGAFVVVLGLIGLLAMVGG
jgi:hypothetical protein